MRPGRRGVRAVLIATVFALLLILSACDGTHHAASSTTPAKPATTNIPVPSTTDPTSAVVLQAYRAGWAAFEHALATANANDPGLPATMVDPQLQHVRANLLADLNAGIVGRGGFVLSPKVSSLSASTATVVDCAYSTAFLVYAKTGKPVPPVTPLEHDGVTTTLVLAGSTWKVSTQNVTDGSCAPGS